MPTLLGLAGVDLTTAPTMDGRSMAELLQQTKPSGQVNQAATVAWRAEQLIEYRGLGSVSVHCIESIWLFAYRVELARIS